VARLLTSTSLPNRGRPCHAFAIYSTSLWHLLFPRKGLRTALRPHRRVDLRLRRSVRPSTAGWLTD
jgi:hypothetical protein